MAVLARSNAISPLAGVPLVNASGASSWNFCYLHQSRQLGEINVLDTQKHCAANLKADTPCWKWSSVPSPGCFLLMSKIGFDVSNERILKKHVEV